MQEPRASGRAAGAMDKRLQYRWPRAPRPYFPMRVVARVEHSEKLDDHGRRVFFGAVDARLLDHIDAMWTHGQYCGPDWLNPSSKPHDPLVVATSTRALERAGLERDVFEPPQCMLPGGRAKPDYDSGPWFEFELKAHGGMPVGVYGDLIEDRWEPAAVASWRRLDPSESFVLDEYFSLKHVGAIDANELGTLQRRVKEEATWATVFDVGQGSCAALRDQYGGVLAYIDLGGGVMANAKTFPAGLRTFCFGREPYIVLSHWDWDHYSSARRDPWAYQQKWIAPYQERVGPVAIRHAADILAHHGQLQLWPLQSDAKPFPDHPGAVGIYRCQGTSRNDSGLAVTFDLENGQRALFPGDADYAFLPPSIGSGARWLVATHHGAEMESLSAPAPAGQNGRLVYSYGKGNVWKHPRKAAFAAHEAGGWPSHPGGKHATVRRTALRKNGGFGHVPLALGRLSAKLCCRESIPPGRKRCDLCPASHQF
jgi:hypothetical protein